MTTLEHPWPPVLPKWFWSFARWCDRGRIPAERPANVPKDLTSYPWLYDRYRVHRGTIRRTVSLSFRPPVAFFLHPDGAGPTEAVPAAKDAGCTGIAVDPLAGDFSAWYPIVRRHGLDLHVWSRGAGYTRELHRQLQAAAGKAGATGTFPNIEDDELRKMQAAGTLHADLAYMGQELDGAPVQGVLTNFWASELWHGSLLSHLTCLPEIQPREAPASVDVRGCVQHALLSFDTALPLLDGREAGRDFFAWQGQYGGIWPADTVTDWGRWPRV